MTKRQLENLKQRLQFLDDPRDRQKLLFQALNRERRQIQQQVEQAQAAIDDHDRRIQRLRFLLEGVALLMPEIGNPREVPLGQLIERVQPTQPELAAQLTEFLRG